MLYLDLETFSTVPIDHGVYKYAEGATILLFAYALDDAPVSVWDTREQMPDALREAIESGCDLLAANANFDRVVLGKCLPGFDWGIERWHDTRALAMLNALPGSLAEQCEVLSVPMDKAKDVEAGKLIHVFCKPTLRHPRCWDAANARPDDWRRFIEYARLDVEALREVWKRLPKGSWNRAERQIWHMDQRINDRGFLVDVELAKAAEAVVAKSIEAVGRQLSKITDGKVTAPSQSARILEALADTGLELPNLRAETVAEAMAVANPKARTILRCRVAGSRTSASKFSAALRSAGRDNRLRGTLIYCGASRTGRWSGAIFQPQNIPRGTIHGAEDLESAVELIKSGFSDLVTDDPAKLASNTIRGLLIAPPGRKLAVSDLSNIEGRVLAWLAREDWKVEAFGMYDKGEGPDLYVSTYARTFGIPAKDVTDEQRQIGKVLELALGYQGGVGAFATFAPAYGVNLYELAEDFAPRIPSATLSKSKEDAEFMRTRGSLPFPDRVWVPLNAIKIMWRDAHVKIARFWNGVENAFREALVSRVPITYNSICFTMHKGSLYIILPSGRSLRYHNAGLAPDGSLCFEGVEMPSRKWKVIPTYGGKIVENIVQATARDVLAYNMQDIENAGFAVVLTVHDEVVAEVEESVYNAHVTLSKLLSANKPWSEGLPLAAKGFETTRYRKG